MKIKILNLLLGFLVAINSSCQSNKIKIMKIHSSAFGNNEMIPSKFTCDGMNVSPALSWSGAPSTVKSYALICDDPDAPAGIWVHWVLFNIPSTMTGLNENFLIKNKPSKEIIEGINDFRQLDYGGPCPPGGTHRYFFKLYALDFFLSVKEGLTADELVSAMEGHVVAKAELVGKYRRK
jgi:Raf kinase inhibitor-like YbhB/YbcL family protein